MRAYGRAGALGVVAVVAALSSTGCDLLKSKEKKAFGVDCAQDLDCESLECARVGSVCTKACTYDSECGGALVCRVRGDKPGQVCSKPSGTAPMAACKEPSECQHGSCLKRVGDPTGPGICSKYCQTKADCPAGMKVCDSISDSGALKMCLPGAETTPAAERPKFTAPVVNTQPIVRPTATTTSTNPNEILPGLGAPPREQVRNTLPTAGQPTATAPTTTTTGAESSPFAPVNTTNRPPRATAPGAVVPPKPSGAAFGTK